MPGVARVGKHSAVAAGQDLEQQLADLQQVKPKIDRLPTPREIAEALKDLQGLLEHGTPQERKTVLEDNIEQILI